MSVVRGRPCWTRAPPAAARAMCDRAYSPRFRTHSTQGTVVFGSAGLGRDGPVLDPLIERVAGAGTQLRLGRGLRGRDAHPLVRAGALDAVQRLVGDRHDLLPRQDVGVGDRKRERGEANRTGPPDAAAVAEVELARFDGGADA